MWFRLIQLCVILWYHLLESSIIVSHLQNKITGSRTSAKIVWYGFLIGYWHLLKERTKWLRKLSFIINGKYTRINIYYPGKFSMYSGIHESNVQSLPWHTTILLLIIYYLLLNNTNFGIEPNYRHDTCYEGKYYMNQINSH